MKVQLINPDFHANYIENLLQERGIENIKEYLNPSIDALQSPEDLKNIGQAAALYLRVCLKNRPRILLVVDSDNDGFTSGAIFYQYTKQVNCHAQIDYWLHEGKQHGLQDHIDRLLDEDIQYDLIALPDSSSNDAHYHDMLDEIHIPCLILDHHLTDVALSDNAIVVNNQLSPNYHNKELTGAGVVYQFCRYIDKKLNQNWADQYIDLAAWGIIGDMGSVLEIENRYIIKNGLSNITNPFFKYLLEKQSYSITGKMSPSWEEILAKTNPISVAFYIVPMVNALIRVGTMAEKELLFKAFIDGEDLVPCNKRGAKGTMEKAAIEAARVATNARSHQNKMLDDIMFSADAKISKYDLLSNKVLVLRLDEEDFPSEINGLLAMRLSAKYKKPTLVLRQCDDGFDKGSGRGPSQTEMKSFKEFLSDSGFFDYAQGHDFAFGCSINDKSLDTFHKYANEKLANIDFNENIYEVNFARSASAADIRDIIIDISNYDGIWGQRNDTPLIYVHQLYITKDDIKVMGTNKDTMKIEYNGVAYMQFKAKHTIDELMAIDGTINLEIVGRANLNEWGGRITPQIFIDAYEIKQNKLTDF